MNERRAGGINHYNNLRSIHAPQTPHLDVYCNGYLRTFFDAVKKRKKRTIR